MITFMISTIHIIIILISQAGPSAAGPSSGAAASSGASAEAARAGGECYSTMY